jgi:hypothetical protein
MIHLCNNTASSSEYIRTNRRMISEYCNELEAICKEALMAQFKIVSRHLPAGTKKGYKTYPVSGQRFEPNVYRSQVPSVSAWAKLLSFLSSQTSVLLTCACTPHPFQLPEFLSVSDLCSRQSPLTLSLIHQPTYALNKIRSQASMKLVHVSTLGVPSSGSYSEQRSARTIR